MDRGGQIQSRAKDPQWRKHLPKVGAFCKNTSRWANIYAEVNVSLEIRAGRIFCSNDQAHN